jgi:hypothetical protein
MNSPSSVKPWTAAIAPKIAVEIETGRMTETTGNFRLRNGHGSGMIRLVWKSSRPNGGDKITSASGAVLAGYAWDSTLQKLR